MIRKLGNFQGVNLCKWLFGKGLKNFENIGFCWPMGARLIENHELTLIDTNDERITN